MHLYPCSAFCISNIKNKNEKLFLFKNENDNDNDTDNDKTAENCHLAFSYCDLEMRYFLWMTVSSGIPQRKFNHPSILQYNITTMKTSIFLQIKMCKG